MWKSPSVLPGDTTPPTATISAPPVTTGSAARQQITVVYADNAAVDVATVGLDDITVTGPAGALPVVTATPTPNTNAASVSVVYEVDPPGGAWDAADDGSYTIALAANAVRDTSANGVAAASGSFLVNTSGTGTGPDLVAAIAPKPLIPTAVVGGSKGRLKLIVTNQGDAPVVAPKTAPVSILLQAVPTTPGTPTDIVTVTRPLKLKPGKSRPVPIKFLYPAGVPDGTYNLVATVDTTSAVAEGNETNNTATTAAPVTIAAPFVDLTAAVGAPARGALAIGRRASVPVILTNGGNVPASGLATVDMFASADNLIGGDTPLATVTRKLKLKNGKARPVRLSFLVPADLPAGSYFIVTSVDTQNAIAESNESNNTAISTVAFPAT